MHGYTVGDIEGAAHAFRTLRQYPNAKLSQIEIASDGQVLLYFDGGLGAYQGMRRVNGRWEFGDGVIVTQ